ncbi:type VI secretion system contractile sheath small subunit, partial [Neisseria sicca]|uniref:type VI secretion system contractile sheath small subunit n=1 Tax=Neisseria sicca TaxID=490 RepID=UPI0034D96105
MPPNPPPPLHIHYHLQLYPSDKKIHLPFLIPLIPHFLAKPLHPLPQFPQPKFFQIHLHNFHQPIKPLKPPLPFNLKNTLTPQPNFNLQLQFQSIHHFSPPAIPKKVGPLNELL